MQLGCHDCIQLLTKTPSKLWTLGAVVEELSTVIAKHTTADLSHKYAPTVLPLTLECGVRSTLYKEATLL